jgi:arylsulfatase A-like enzyme
MDSNYNKPDPFFVYYPMALAHKPFSPTPDDPEFASWDPNLDISDTSFFPSMIKYMDKKIGVIINKVQALGLTNNTVILYVGDNGSPVEIYSMFEGHLLRGGKGETTRIGTCVPFIAYSPGNVLSNFINNDLIDFTDFLPTIASLANIPKPLDYGILDGVDFAWQLYGNAGTARSHVFCHFDPHPGHGHIARWAQTIQYKKYDSLTNTNQRNRFYDIISDGAEFHAIPAKSRTPEEKKINKTFDALFRTMHN